MNNTRQIDIKLPYNYSTYPHQKNFWESMKTKKRAVIVWHRRSGKEKTCWNYMISQAVRKIGIYYYFFPEFSQGRRVLWDGIDMDGFRFIDHIPRELIQGVPNSSEMKIRLWNNSIIQVVGTNNFQAIRGTNPVGAVFSEYSMQDPEAWDTIRPIFTRNGGWAIFNFTPFGHNHAKDLYDMSKGNREWFCERLTVNDTKIITESEVQAERDAGMSEEMIQQEFFCSFNRGIEGAYYAKLINKMHDEERICDFLYDPYKLVHVSFDLGWDDSTAIIFFQVEGSGVVKIIDYEERSNTTLAQWKAILMEKGYKYGIYLFPHDVEHIDGLSTGCTRKEILEDLGIPVTTVSRSLIVDGVESVKALMSSRLFINKKCDRLIKSLENYYRDWDDKNKIYSNKPKHTWASHGADALRYLAQGLSKINSSGSLENDYKALQKYWGD